jgi:hypothetical protein
MDLPELKEDLFQAAPAAVAEPVKAFLRG